VYVTITRVATGEQQLQNAKIVGQEMSGWLSDMPGFEGLLMLSREGETLGISFWASEEDMERQGTLRAEFVERIAAVARVDILDRLPYEVTFSRLSPAVNEVIE
jgi:heme-degrading monooxygenase HmoA